MVKILFLIHDLGHGGAEKVLVNLVNNLDRTKFDISVTALFGGGVNEQFLKDHIHYRAVFPRMIPGNSHWMKLLSPGQLHRLCVRERYDIEVSYLEGPSARVISGCGDPAVRKACWIHIEQRSQQHTAKSFRNYQEALRCYNSFQRIISVSQRVQDTFLQAMPVRVPTSVLYNTNESKQIRENALLPVEPGLFNPEEIKLIGVGKLIPGKGFYRLIPILKQLLADGLPVHLYLLGIGPMKEQMEQDAARLGVDKHITFLGYQTNPYKYVSKCDLFVCASFAEGFSTAATEALIVGTPVCTVEVSGMKEMLGENNEWGIVTENNEEALYRGIKGLLEEPARLAYYKEKAVQRGRDFSTEETVRAVEEMLLSL